MQARKTTGGSDPDYSKDLARFAAFVAEEVGRLDPKAWVTYASGTGFDVESIQNSRGWQDAARPARGLSTRIHSEDP